MVSPIVIGGPTGSGKSAYALTLAQEIGGEIICADSRQVYIGMRIGTASPTDEELALVPHHNFNFLDPKDTYDAAQFIEDADQFVADIMSRGKVPILVGGTGLYLRCWRFGLSDVPKSDEGIRAELKQQVAQKGIDALYEELKALDPDSASNINSKDEFRVIRALEIFKMTGEKASSLRRSHFQTPRQEALWYLLKPDREVLSQTLLQRTRRMFEQGLVEEALALRDKVGIDNPLLRTIAYQESLAFSDGLMDLEPAIERAYFRTRQYAKRQMNWFSKEMWWEIKGP